MIGQYRSSYNVNYFNVIMISSLLSLTSSNVFAAPLVDQKKNIKAPAASEVFITKLPRASRSGNAQINVKYDARNLDKSREAITVKIDNKTITLKDDGNNADKTANDYIYSSTIDFNFDELIKSYQRLDRLKEKFGKEKGLPKKFKGRELIGNFEPMNAKELAQAIEAGTPIPINPLGISATIDSERSLLIRHSSVIQDPDRTFNICTSAGDPNGVWTFKHLITEMANTAATGVAYEDFTRIWLENWVNSQTVNNWTAADRQAILSKIITPWENASGGPGSPLDLDKAPFQLLAIVNRIDLRENGVDAGEGRFVFQLMDMTNNCAPMQFTTIFEYGIDQNSCTDVKAWGQRWADLSNLTLGSEPYKTALESITESFVLANSSPNKPNGSALNQLRTNEIDLASPWQLREFRISDTHWDKHLLRQNTVKLTPDNSLNGSTVLADFINGTGGTSSLVPQRFPSITDPFLGASSEAPTPAFFWNSAGITSNQARHEFSLDTCNGCHAGETNTLFTHIKPGVIPVTGAALSGFMTGINVTDPVDNTTVRTFNDLQRRATDLDGLLNSSCLSQLSQPVINAAH